MDSEPGVCVILLPTNATLSDHSFTVYGLAQANKAVLPRDAGGPWGQRMGVSVGGSESWSLVVSAYQTMRNNPSDWNRYSLVRVCAYWLRKVAFFNRFHKVVMNWADSTTNPVQTTIEFRGKQAKISFPVGVTT
jgi:hypothetical protein